MPFQSDRGNYVEIGNYDYSYVPRNHPDYQGRIAEESFKLTDIMGNASEFVFDPMDWYVSAMDWQTWKHLYKYFKTSSMPAPSMNEDNIRITSCALPDDC